MDACALGVGIIGQAASEIIAQLSNNWPAERQIDQSQQVILTMASDKGYNGRLGPSFK